jgi:hypothetical protein
MPAAFCNVTAVTAVTNTASQAGTSWRALLPPNGSPITGDTFKSASDATPGSAAWVANLPYLPGSTCLQVPPVSTVIDALQSATGAPPPMPQLNPTNVDNAVYAVGTNVCSLYAQDTNPSASIPPLPQPGYEYWSGTSFATAIISGNLAANSGSLPGTLDESQPCS